MNIGNIILRRKLQKSEYRLRKVQRKRNAREHENRRLKSELRQTKQQLDEIMDRMTVELCPCCEREVMLVWEEKDSISAHCPYCGSTMMLCSLCENRCDYDAETDLCSEM